MSSSSIVIPVFNGARFIRKTIESVLLQTHEDFELLIVDNVSTDDTLEIANSFNDPRMKVIAESNHVNLPANFNRALTHAKGKYIKILPADDLLHPTCLAKQLQCFEEHADKDIAIVSCYRDIINESGKRCVPANPKFKGLIDGNHAVRRTVRAGANILGEPGATLMPRQLLIDVGGFNVTLPFVSDLDLWFRALRNRSYFVFPEVLTSFRISRFSMSYVLQSEQTRQYHQLIRNAEADADFGISLYDSVVGRWNSFVRAQTRWLAYRLLLSRHH